jgi:nitrogen fixation NifU-like protein
MSDLRDIYQEVIFDHYRAPRNCRALAGASHKAEGYNPLCGDKVTVYLRIHNGLIQDASFQGVGCAISTATASLMTEALKGRRIDDVERMFGAFHDMVTGAGARQQALGKLEALTGVRQFPSRVKCATLAWHTLLAALKGAREPVSTE